jgi:hypothetical protein
MVSILLHNINIVVRTIFYMFWAWVFYFDGLQLSPAMRSFVDCLVLADIVTWLMYQFYLLPRMMIHFSIGTLVNLVVIAVLYKDAKSLVPSSVDMQAMALMVFFSMAAVKGFYYLSIELGYAGSRTSR